MSSDIPIDFTELAQLTSVGIQPASLDFKSTTLESDRYVCVRETGASGNTVAIVDLYNNNEVTRKNMTADNAIMHPTEFVISLRANGTTIQIFNLGSKQRLKSYTMDEPVVFWKWLNNEYLGLITGSAVFYWNVFDGTNNGPIKLTERHHSLNNAQIINIVAEPDLNWFAINGIAQEDGRIAGHIQLFSKTRNVSQAIEGHVSKFASIKLSGAAHPTKVFCVGNKNAQGQGNLHIIEIDHVDGNPPFPKKSVDIFFPPDATNDFPISLQASDKYGIVYILTKYGFIHLYDMETGSNLFVNRITADPVFTASAFKDGTGIITINKAGQVLSVEVSRDRIVPYVLDKLSNVSLALSLSSRGGFPGAENLFTQQFQNYLNQGDYTNAAKVAASSEQLRTPDTINKLKHITPAPGQISPILQYFSTLLDRGTLNKYESIELAKPVLQQDRKPLFEKWLKEDKLTSSEELGDIVKSYNDTTLALAVYIRANVHIKVVSSLAELGQFDKIMPYCQKVGYSPDYTNLIQNLVRVNPDKASEFATSLLQTPDSNINVENVADLFFSQNYIQQGTAFLLDALKNDSPAEGHLQTKVLEINLLHAPQVADAILGNNMFSHYDKPSIGKLCEKSGLFQRALEHYDDLKDIKRVIVHTNVLPNDWLVAYFGQLTVEQTVACIKELLSNNMQQNLQVIIQVATKYSDLIGPLNLIKIFETYKCTEGEYYYLSSIVNLTQEPDVVFKYIQCAARMNQPKEIERVVRDNNVYNGEKVKNFLKEFKLDDQLPLIIVCDRFNFVHDLILYLYKNQYFKFIEVYVQQVNSANTPQVVAGLLDVDCDETIIKNLLNSVIGRVPIKELVVEVEKRNRLKILLPFLEATLQGGSNDQEVYNTLAKIYIDSNNSPEKFLQENSNYDTLVVGKYCEKRDPYLAYISYSKGGNDDELINITNENKMYKYQARYLLAKSDFDLWNKVLGDDNIHRRQLIDQVISTGIPELDDPEPISLTVKAFMENDLPQELIELLEKIILEPSPFNDNTSLQGLLILTAIKADPSRVMNYIEKLDKYDPQEIAPLCIDAQLYEEAFEIYDRFELRTDAMRVLVEDIMSLDRGEQYAEKFNTSELWYQLGTAQLNGLRIPEAIESYVKSKNPENFEQVIEISERAGKEEELVPFLDMARETLREPLIDGALINCYASLGRLSEIESFVSGPNVADSESIGDKLFEAKNYKGAKILYSNVSKYSKLATTLVYLEDYQGAVECARKASNINVWKQVNNACIENKEFRLAQICGLNLIIDAEELPELVKTYEWNGYFNELISLFENGLSLERAHMGMFTELAILYSKYSPEKVMEHLKLFWSRINIPKVLTACEEAHLYPELIFLYCHYEEWDNAALTMIEKSEVAFDHLSFKEIIVKAPNLEIYYKAINFYLAENPSLLVDLLSVLAPKLDLPRVVRMFVKSDNLPLIKPFLISVLEKNNSVVNGAYHDLLIEEDDYKSLKEAIENDAYNRFNSLDLAERLENHEIIFFRQISATLYTKNKKFTKSISILKNDKLWPDLIKTAAVSNSTKIAHELLDYFVETGNHECFVALLYTCYDLIEYDYVIELTWLHNLANFVKPYEISVAAENQKLLNEVYADLKKRREAEQQDEDAPINQPLMITNGNAGMAGIGFQPTGAGFGNPY
ncbi:Clathrin heavy chain [Yamadazyma tenuis]|uniref:Clathrin heavy chain n=1 Tax=Candida tenuis (strain ATCC 10573 / BCRC 21748 / CBS 615 / JCM 9827 / NBRC 10315 / NRRL Y-1498 / VKM Y-70) TaxID=590646 RepID=G3B757_CANTC|nr:clathrin heavy chain [Yamadazyma tenuis ATCC 10573]EGV63105.1 clathrin heavy chain [Yamadazyma tenuis ATCC 10573]WEJ97080.1 Clathrin heavy chain [Yamadazyma tenuis]